MCGSAAGRGRPPARGQAGQSCPATDRSPGGAGSRSWTSTWQPVGSSSLDHEFDRVVPVGVLHGVGHQLRGEQFGGVRVGRARRSFSAVRIRARAMGTAAALCGSITRQEAPETSVMARSPIGNRSISSTLRSCKGSGKSPSPGPISGPVPPAEGDLRPVGGGRGTEVRPSGHCGAGPPGVHRNTHRTSSTTTGSRHAGDRPHRGDRRVSGLRRAGARRGPAARPGSGRDVWRRSSPTWPRTTDVSRRLCRTARIRSRCVPTCPLDRTRSMISSWSSSTVSICGTSLLVESDCGRAQTVAARHPERLARPRARLLRGLRQLSAGSCRAS